MSRTAVVLFNLGGPDGPDAVKPFLFNLFNDRAIITLPQPLRFLLAKLISGKRAPVAREIYRHLGGGSPILPQTKAQAEAMQEKLGSDYKIFIAMRYWHPRAEETVRQVKDYAPERVILLPLYPQYSTTTSRSSMREWQAEAKRQGVSAATHTVCCYPTDSGFSDAYAQLLTDAFQQTETWQRPRIIFSAHGLPEHIIEKGDPYQWQVEQSVATIVKKLGRDDLDYRIGYQSRVGRLKWIGPSTEDLLKEAGSERVPVIIVPVAFVSEHSETLVELDIEYKHLAEESGVPHYLRVPTVTTHPAFIEGLARLCIDAGEHRTVSSGSGQRLCPDNFTQCACR